MYFLPDGMHEAIKLVDQQAIKEENLKRIFLALHRHGEISRAELKRMTGLGAATISTLVDELVRLNLFVEVGLQAAGNVGRRPINLDICAAGRILPVFSLSRRGVDYTLFDLSLGAIEHRFVPCITDQYGGFELDAPDANPDTGNDYPDIIQAVLSESEHYNPSLCMAVCVVFPGLYLQEKQAFSLTAMHVSFSRKAMALLEKNLKVPLFFGNSSMSRAYAEKKQLDLEDRSVDDLLFINICEGMGVGAGILCGGEPFLGASNTAGEIGHVTIDRHGKRCVCGNRGCLEQYVYIDAVVQRVRHAIKARPGGFFNSHDNITLESIGLAYAAGDVESRAVVDDIADMLFRGIYSAICITGIRRVVIGGFEQLGHGFLNRMRALVSENGGRMLMHGVSFDYPKSDPEDESLGIAEYFIDKVFRISG